MTDRPQGSVRTGSRSGTSAADGGAPADGDTSVADGGAPVDGAAHAPGQPVPTDTGTRAMPGVQPATGAHPAAAAGAEPGPATGTQAIPSAGTRPNPATGTQRVTGASADPPTAAPVAVPPSMVPPVAVPPSMVPPVAVPPAAGPAARGAAAQSGTSGAANAQATVTRGRPGRPGRGPRRARLQLRHIDTWSALKISLVLSIALFFIWMVAVGVLYLVLNALGVFDTVNELFGQLGTDGAEEAAGEVLTPGVVFGGATVIGAINIVLLTALCTVGTFIYNMCSDLVGGLEVTLSERD